MKLSLISRAALTSLASTLFLNCGGDEVQVIPDDLSDGTGGYSQETSGGAPGDLGSFAGSGGESASGGSQLGDGSGGVFESTGGVGSTDGVEATGGETSGGAATGGAEGTPDGEGCAIDQVGFSTLNGQGQNGTYGGRDGEIVTVANQSELNLFATASEPYVIRVQGKIVISPKGTEIRVASNKTIVGIGESGEISQGGFFLGTGVHNVIIRNLTIGDTYKEDDPDGKDQDWDGVQMDAAHHVWIDHCDFHHIGDGIIDSRKDTTNLTVSWNIFRDHNKAFGIGWTENVTAEMTIHHNILRNTQQRNPSTDNVLRAHLFNNWMQNITSYGNYARGGTNMVLENSVFEKVNNPHYYDTGSLVARGNLYTNITGQRESSGSTYLFFDPREFYEYSLDPAEGVTAVLSQCAGPQLSLGK